MDNKLSEGQKTMSVVNMSDGLDHSARMDLTRQNNMTIKHFREQMQKLTKTVYNPEDDS